MTQKRVSKLRAVNCRVVKLGGSLLAWPDWSLAFRQWQRPSHSRDVLIVGGGRRVDQLRKLDQQIGLSQAACHAIALRMMTANAHRVARELGVNVVSSFDPKNARDSLCVLDVENLDAQQPLTDHRGHRMPKHWDVTSDSLAAAVAHRLSAKELVLLKSMAPPPRRDWHDSQFVDPMFASSVSPALRVSAVNLRNDRPALAGNVAFSAPPHSVS